MRFQTTASFDGDLARLSKEEKQRFLDALNVFVPACDRYARDSAARWPTALRVKGVGGAPGVWEMTCFSGPDGRATFEFVQIDGSLGLRWRRVGGHSIFRNP